MRHKTARSTLLVVSYLFLFMGLIALVEMIYHTAKGRFHFNFGILGIGIFAGLRRYSQIWRMCALLFTIYGIATISFALFVCLNGDPFPANPILASQKLTTVPANWLVIPLGMVLMVTLWQFRVLTHPAIRRLFVEEPQPAIVPEESADAAIKGVVGNN
jgi:hypothetical protein